LIERENGVYSFTHQTFQEYLAASYIREKGLANVLAEAVNDVWWRETTLLYAARADADLIVSACLGAGSVTALVLAFDCADQQTELAPELRRRLDEYLTEARNPTADLERRRLVSRVLLTRELRRVIPVADGGHLCAAPITNNIYLFFLGDMAAKGQIRTPDGPWDGNATGDTVRGVRHEDAEAFAAWVNDLIGDPHYRLPTREEIEDPAALPALGAPLDNIWLQRNGKHPERWTATGIDRPYTIEASDINERVAGDVRNSAYVLLRLLYVRSAAAVSLVSQGRYVELDRDLDLASRLGLDMILSSDRDLIARLRSVLGPGDLERSLRRDLSLARDLDLDSVGHGGRRGLTRVLDLDLALNHALNLACALSPSLRPCLGRDFVAAFGRLDGLDGDVSGGQVLDHALGLDLALDLALELDGESRGPMPSIDYVSTQVMGVAIGRAVNRALDVLTSARRPGAFKGIQEFHYHVAHELSISPTTYALSLEGLAGKARDWQLYDTRISTKWFREMTVRLEQDCGPVLRREQAIDSQSAARIRLSALCLAAEVDAQTGKQNRNIFRGIAAGITLLEQRVSGDRPPDETIILAAE
jgi:hypothetical protein